MAHCEIEIELSQHWLALMGLPFPTIAAFINKSKDQVIRYWKKYEQGGAKACSDVIRRKTGVRMGRN